MTIERRHEYRLQFAILINDKKCLMSFPKCGLHFFVFKIDRVIQHLDSFIVFYINSNLNKFPNISMNYEGKNGRPRFGNPETSNLWC